MSASTEKNPLLRQLAALRRRLRFVVLMRGIGWLFAIVLITGILGGYLDWLVHLPEIVRVFILSFALVGAGYVLLRYLLVPMLQRTDNLSLALQIEERFPSLNDSLASTVQFLEQSAGGHRSNDSSKLRLETARQVMTKMGQYDFRRVIDSRGLVPAVTCGIGAVAIVACFYFFSLLRSSLAG